jgi:hypothetical protein
MLAIPSELQKLLGDIHDYEHGLPGARYVADLDHFLEVDEKIWRQTEIALPEVGRRLA